jgi:hypothetical protein
MGKSRKTKQEARICTPGKTCTFPTFANRLAKYAPTLDPCKQWRGNYSKNCIDDDSGSGAKEIPPSALALGGCVPVVANNCSYA